MSSEGVKHCNEPQAHPERCGCAQPDRYADPDYCKGLEQERDYLRDELKKVKADRKACWAEFKIMTRACLDAEEERDALSAELAALKAASGEEVVVVAFLYEDGDVLGKCDMAAGTFSLMASPDFRGGVRKLMTVTQHQRITAALRGEVERLNRDAKNDAVAYKAAIERQEELRAELDAIRKQEPVARVGMVPGTDFKSVDFFPDLQSLPVGMEFYAAPPAAAMDGGMVPVKLEVLEAAEHWLQIHSWPGATEWLVADEIGDAISTHRQASQQEGEP